MVFCTLLWVVARFARTKLSGFVIVHLSSEKGSLDYLLDNRARTLERTRTLANGAVRHIPSFRDSIGGRQQTLLHSELMDTSDLALEQAPEPESEYRRNARHEMAQKRALADSMHRAVRASVGGRSLIPLETQRIFAEAM